MNSKLFSAITWVLFLALLIAGITFLFSFLGNRPKPEIELPAPISVSFQNAELGEISPSFTFTGEIKAKQEALISAEVNNVNMVELLVDVGEEVKKGQLLAKFDDESLNYQMIQAKSSYEQARDEYNRNSSLSGSGLISQEALIQKRTAMQAAQARLADAELNLNRANLKSPVNGVIFNRTVDIGSLVNSSQPIFSVAIDGVTEFVAQVPENQLGLFVQGQQVNLKLSGQALSQTGKIRLIQPNIDPNSRTAKVYISLESPKFLPIGLFGTATIVKDAIHGTLLPTTAIQIDEQGSYVWVINKENRIEKLHVNELARHENQVVVQALDASTQIILRAGSLINEGDLVNPVKIDAKQN